MSNIGHVLCDIMSNMQSAIATERAKLIDVPSDSPSWTRTERVLARMLRENTGTHILDSGSTYGRAWQHNLSVDFRQDADSTIEFNLNRDGDLWIDVTHNLFHWLAEAVEYDRCMTRHLRAFGKTSEFEKETWFEVVQHFPEWLAKRWKCKIGGIYGEGEPLTIYTYNHECFTSQDFQYTYWQCEGGPHDGEEFAAIFIHNGCDARSGFTDPVVFKAPLDGNGTIGIFDYKRASITPDFDEVEAVSAGLREHMRSSPALFPATDTTRAEDIARYREVRWLTDDGYHFTYEGPSRLHGSKLADYPVRAIEERSQWEPGILCVLPDKSGLCPITGCTLHSWFY